MNSIGKIQPYSPRWQCIVLLFAVLDEVRGGLTKIEATGRIAERGWFDFQAEDMLPYPSNRLTTREPRWRTIIAWVRKDGVENRLMQGEIFDNWDLENSGRDTFAAVARDCRDERLHVRYCYLWSAAFKLRMCPAYAPSQPNRKRPLTLYSGDWITRNIDTFLADIL